MQFHTAQTVASLHTSAKKNSVEMVAQPDAASRNPNRRIFAPKRKRLDNFYGCRAPEARYRFWLQTRFNCNIQEVYL
jgi:hypothetical protein